MVLELFLVRVGKINIDLDTLAESRTIKKGQNLVTVNGEDSDLNNDKVLKSWAKLKTITLVMMLIFADLLSKSKKNLPCNRLINPGQPSLKLNSIQCPKSNM